MKCLSAQSYDTVRCKLRNLMHWLLELHVNVLSTVVDLTSLLNLVEDTAVTKENGPHVCQSCGKVYQQKRTLQRHLRYECGVPPQFQCVMCPYRSKHRSHLTRHLVTVHNQLLQDAELNKGVVIS
ncbi:hypothetical protein J6590_014691 [Homalodisca vitripennis]|nr:hypothetical protein J6590_014691 [Homalodisca vitripennis]